MLDRTGDWCFEGGCSYLTDADNAVSNESDIAELEALYLEPCMGSLD